MGQRLWKNIGLVVVWMHFLVLDVQEVDEVEKNAVI